MNLLIRMRLASGLIGLLALTLCVGCSARPPGYQMVRPTTLDQATEESPENQLVDVGVTVSEARELSEKKTEKLGTNEDIRKSETRFVPVHLRNTLQSSGHWGAVWVVPPEDDSVDLTVHTEIVASNGEMLQLEVEAVDATGGVWLSRKYHAEATAEDYDAAESGEREVFQALYNTIANDLVDFKRSLTPEDVTYLRTVSRLQYAKKLSPDAFDDYLSEPGPDGIVVQRLPADDDPQMQRVEMVRERNDMFRDTLNQYYEGYYINMWDAYADWRRFNLAEVEALREMEQQGLLKTVGGVLMIAGAIALGIDDSAWSSTASGALIIGGGAVMIDGINVSQQAKIHAEAIEELSSSFGNEMRPTVLELEGKQYELTGTASEQYEEWQVLLRRIYYEETGFDPDLEKYGEDDPAPATLPPGT